MADVICPGCREMYHETTDKFNPDVLANGSMFRMKEPWASWGWSTFFNNDSVGYGELVCPGCDAPYAPSGYVELDEDTKLTPQDGVFACEACGFFTTWETSYLRHLQSNKHKQNIAEADDGKLVNSSLTA